MANCKSCSSSGEWANGCCKLQPLSIRPDFSVFREDMEIVSTFVAALG